MDHCATFLTRKMMVLLKVAFISCTVSALVSSALKESLHRVLSFTVQLQHTNLRRIPLAPLIVQHFISTLVFVLMIVGIVIFFGEFLGDVQLALLLLVCTFVTEMFLLICVRTSVTTQLFPQFLVLLMTLFLVYYFTFPFGFTYLAAICLALLLQYIMLFFLNHFEIPALHSGQISHAYPRQNIRNRAELNFLSFWFLRSARTAAAAPAVHAPARPFNAPGRRNQQATPAPQRTDNALELRRLLALHERERLAQLHPHAETLAPPPAPPVDSQPTAN
eukprot:TRINITY_DN386_c0_g1_i4.p1 TRINITY_DN386_c0_g1~~TRINITY_DN386_c0_g1_i4.p1  ORF type:complete len:277 (-),score=68.23 TRINITY_DN386_c0_g1_i4:46-876(-)